MNFSKPPRSKANKWNYYWSKFRFMSSFFVNQYHNHRIEIQKFLGTDKKILEIGCGTNPTTAIGKNSFFVDTSSEAIKYLKRLGAKCKVGDVTHLRLKASRFNIVLAFEILEHVRNDERALRNLNKVLKPRGLFIFSVPINMKIWSVWDEIAGHVRRYETDEILDKLKMANFKLKLFCLKKLTPIEKIGQRVFGNLIRHFPALFLAFDFLMYRINLLFKLDIHLGRRMSFKRFDWKKPPLEYLGNYDNIYIIAQKT